MAVILKVTLFMFVGCLNTILRVDESDVDEKEQEEI